MFQGDKALDLPRPNPTADVDARDQENPAPQKTPPEHPPSGGGFLTLSPLDPLRNAEEDLGPPDLEVGWTFMPLSSAQP